MSCLGARSRRRRSRRPRARRRRGRHRQVTVAQRVRDHARTPARRCSPDRACRSPTPFPTRPSPRSSATSRRAGRRRPGPFGRRPGRPLPVLRLGRRPARRRIGGAAAGRASSRTSIGPTSPPATCCCSWPTPCAPRRSSSWRRGGRRSATGRTACRSPSASWCDRDGRCRSPRPARRSARSAS